MFHGKVWNGRRLEVREDRAFSTEGRSGGDHQAPRPIVGTSSDYRHQPPPREHQSQQRTTHHPQRSTDSSARSGGGGGKKLYIGNIPYTFRWQEIKDLLRPFGNVLRADVPMDDQQRSKGYAEVIMGSAEEAQAAIEGLDEQLIEGRTLEVREDKYADQQPQGSQIFIGNVLQSIILLLTIMKIATFCNQTSRPDGNGNGCWIKSSAS